MSKPARSFLLAVPALLILAGATAAWGRAGGGESYSGGGSRSSGSTGWRSSSGSRSSSSGSLPLACTCPLTVAIILYVVLKGRAGRQTAAAIGKLAPGRALQTPEQLAEGLRRIAARDPAFTPDEALGTARRLFMDLQAAWSRGDLALVRRGLSDGVLRRFTVQLALNAFWKRRNVTADVRILEATLIGVECDDEFDTLHVRFAASARDCDVPVDLPEPQAMARAAQAAPTRFEEYWTFVRRLNPSRAGRLSEGRCPSCGAPVPTQATVSCEYCKAILNSGEFDWVLSEITQSGELKLRPEKPAEGFARLKAVDPAVNRQVLEDRASLVFWKWVEAQATGEPRRFARLCTAASLNELTLARPQPTERFARTAVGAVDLSRVVSDADFDRASFELRWSTAGASAGVVHTSVLTLARRAGVKTSSKTGMSTDRCHSCAAPQTEGDAVECGHCGALLTQDWAFEELVSLDAFRARHQDAEHAAAELQARLADLADPWERRRALSVMVAMARADGVVTERETKLLRECARRWTIESAHLQALLAAPLEELSAVVPKGLEEARALYRALAAAALVDGRVDSEERRLLESMATHLKLSPEEARALLKEMEVAARHLRAEG